ncbi:MAG TPA: FG-GAP-like repeat-containing protein, partial [Anaerolineae bacterium]|nr:FG-GAP-like repeat-containing protein [Anaerolineae bacterium]
MKKRTFASFLAFFLANLFTLAIFASVQPEQLPVNQVDTSATSAPFSLISHNPTTNALGLPLNTPITATFDANVAPASVTNTTFAAHTSFGGLLTGNLNVSGNTITLNPNRTLFPGEQVQMIATTQISSTGGLSLSPSTQWGFTAGPITSRCAGGFTDVSTTLPAINNGSVAWGDYDNDGDLDILMTGLDGTTSISRVYNNNGGTFTDIGAGLVGVRFSSVAWGDYDNDGDLDILLTGLTSAGLSVANVYRNDAGTFTNIGASLTAVTQGSVAWGDYDNDGDLDILLTGRITNLSKAAQVYRNDNGIFTDIGAGLTGVNLSSVDWGDYDNDGDLDILLTGFSTETPQRVAKVYNNNGGVFTDINAGLTGVLNSSVDWGDYDNDGDLDILLTGQNLSSDFVNFAQVYRNDDGVFTDINAGLTGVDTSSVAWGDYDNDGDLDILLTGQDNNAVNVSQVYRNDAGHFAPINTGLTGVDNSSAAWGDYDNDGDLDILLTGNNVTQLYRNNDCLFLTDNGPDNQSLNMPLNTVITATFDADLRLTSVFSRSFSAHTTFGGLLTGTVSATGNTITLIPNRDFFTGERIQITASPTIRKDSTGGQLNPTQWGFTAGPVTSTCLVGFTEVSSTGLTNLRESSTAWGDYDNDGDLDVLLTGKDSTGTRLSLIYRNDGGTFTDINANLTGVSLGDGSWGDYDNDGDLDVLIVGSIDDLLGTMQIYRNNAGIFTDISAGLPGLRFSHAAWGDYDNDGDLDILALGQDASNVRHAKVYRNHEGTFTDINAGLVGVSFGGVDWGDYDNDGDLDILLTGLNNGGPAGTLLVYRNDNGVFTDIEAGLIRMERSDVAWGDYDNDGDLDILASGELSDRMTLIYNNDGGVFTDINAGLVNSRFTRLSWGDYDNDGDLDILLVGQDDSNNKIAIIYRNDAGIFTDINAGFGEIGVIGDADWGDYDNDGDLDVLVSGGSGPPLSNTSATKIFENENCPLPFTLTSHNPITNELGVSLDTPITASFNANVSAATVTSATFAAHTSFTGLLTGTLSVSGDTITLNPTRDLFAGEQVQVIATANISDADGAGLTNPTQWGFTAGPVTSRCVDSFTEISGTGLTGARNSSAAWGDYDNDGDLDIVVIGRVDFATLMSTIYRNDGGTFTDINAGLTPVEFGRVAWGDYDNDGDLDILLTGFDGSVQLSQIYRNDAGSFTNINASLLPTVLGDIAWGDYDNDGDLDILLTGANGSTKISRIYR